MFGLVTADIWRLSDAYGWDRLAGTALVSIGATVATLIIGAEIWRDQIGHPAALRDYFELAWLTSLLAMIGGALGAALEPDVAVRAAAYVQHFEDEADIEQAA